MRIKQTKQRLQKGNNIIVAPPLPNLKMDVGYPLVLNAGKHKQGHDDASKKVTTHTCIAIVNLT
jgi:hypothetical protein